MTQIEVLAASRAYYTRLFADGDDGLLGFAACVTVLPGARDVAEVVDRIGTVIRQVDELTAGELSEASLDLAGGEVAVAWLARTDDAVVLVEETGRAGASTEVLRALSWGGHRVVNARFATMYPSASTAVAEDGQVQTTSLSNPVNLGSVPELRPLLETVDPDDDESHPVDAFAIAEVLSGVRLHLPVFEGPWPAIWFRPPQEHPQRPPGQLGSLDAELAMALQNATSAAYLDACRHLAAAVATAVGEADDPTVTALLDDMSNGRAADRRALATLAATWSGDYHLPDGGWPDPIDPVWRRSMAGGVLLAVATDIDDVDTHPRTPYSFVEAGAAMGGLWREFRDRVVAELGRDASGQR